VSPAAGQWNRFVEVPGLGLCLVSNKQNRPTDIWRFDGQAWTLHARHAVTVNGRNAPAVAWDDRRGELVMHGGDVGGQPLADTWEWDRTSWRLRTSLGPLPRHRHDMVFDAARGEVVLFGGLATNGTRLGDTWVWNGSFWQERFGIASPGARYDLRLSFDPHRGRVVLFGGHDNFYSDSHDWDGAAWTAHAPAVRPPAVSAEPITFDSHRRVAVALVNAHGANTTWELAILPAVAGRWTAFGTACPTSAGLPVFAAVTAAPVVGESFRTQVTNMPTHPLAGAVGVLGASRTSWNGIPLPVDLGIVGMTGCTLLAAPDLFLPLPRAGSTADWTLPIPLDHALAGAGFFQQVILGDPGINVLGLAATSGGDAVVGRR
jgi:hypothetical protein